MPQLGSLSGFAAATSPGALAGLPVVRAGADADAGGFQPAFGVDEKGGRNYDTLAWLNSVPDLDSLAITPSGFDLARLKDAFAALDIGRARESRNRLMRPAVR